MFTALPDVPKEVQEIATLFMRMRFNPSVKPDVAELIVKSNDFLKFIESLFDGWFPSAKFYSDEHIAGQIFVTSVHKDCKNLYIKCEILALLGSMKRILKNISKLNENPQKNEERVLDEIELLGEIVSEAIEFLDSANLHMKGVGFNWGHMKRGQAFSLEIFNASQMLLRGKIYQGAIGDYVVRPTSVFLLRQAIDIRIKNAFAINYICDAKGKPLPVSWRHIIEIIRDHPEGVHFPMTPSVLLKIHDWTEAYIHLGKFPYTWKIEFAQLLLGPLFASGEATRSQPDGARTTEWNAFGAIKITKTFFDGFTEELKQRLASLGPKYSAVTIQPLPGKPEAMIVEKLDE